MSKRAERRRINRVVAKQERMMDSLTSAQRAYMAKVQYLKALAFEIQYPWEEVNKLFERATTEWASMNLPDIVDHLAEELRRNRIEHPHKMLKFNGMFLVPIEKSDGKN